MNSNANVETKQIAPSTQGFKFQVNLRALIELLSNSLYSGPQVFVRELLQNAVDAIQARQAIEPKHRGDITIELVPGGVGQASTLLFADNGIGLTMEEIHTFLATIGSSSKREELQERRVDYLGQFGIGLLSCFIVTEEIVLITRSAEANQPALEWRGKADGSYTIRVLETEIAPGTQVFLRPRPERAGFFKEPFIREMARDYGSLLTIPITLVIGERKTRINAERIPWRETHADDDSRREAYLQYGRETFGFTPFDFIPLQLPVQGVEGVAFILPFTPNLASKQAHHVYVKGMLLAEAVDNVVPEWAFFVKCVINSSQLRPTASREALYEDEVLEATRLALGEAVRCYLMELATHHPERLLQFLAIYAPAIQLLAVQDLEFCKLVIGYLPFETSLGRMTLNELKQRHAEIRYVSNVDEFRQISQVAAAQSLCIVNAGYAHGEALLKCHGELFPSHPVSEVSLQDLMGALDEVSSAQRDRAQQLVARAHSALQPFNCRASVKKFLPAELPVLYSLSEESRSRRSSAESPELCFNCSNSLVQKLLNTGSPQVAQLIIETLYIQALLLGHHTLETAEMRLLTQSLSNLAALTMDSSKDEGFC